MLNALEKPGWRDTYQEAFVYRLLDYIGLYRSLTLISYLEEKSATERSSKSIFEAFLNLLFEQKLLTKGILLELQQEKVTQHEGSNKTAKTKSTWKPSSLRTDKQSGNQYFYDYGSYGAKRKTSKESPGSNKSVSQDLFTSNEIDKSCCFYGESANSQRMRLYSNDNDGFKDVSRVSIDTSDMAVSNYSLKSGAMLDSYSEPVGEYELSLEGGTSDGGGKEKLQKQPRRVSEVVKRDKSSLLEYSSERSGNMNLSRKSQGSKGLRSSRLSTNILMKYT